MHATRIGAAATGRLRRQRVRVPWHLVASPHYSKTAVGLYIKIAALAQRPEGCTAGVAVLAEMIGTSVSGVERAITQLRRPDPDGPPPWLHTTRQTLPGGRGTTAERHVRRPAPGDPYVWVSVAAVDTLPLHLVRLYAALAYAGDRRMPVAEHELARLLNVSTRTAGTYVDDLESTGWITVHRRAGDRGRHIYQVHRLPGENSPDPTPGPGASSATSDGSGSAPADGSLAIKEDHRTDPLEKTAQVDGGIRRRRPQVVGGRAVDKDEHPHPGSVSGAAFPPVVLRVLAPVADLLPQLTDWEVRRITRAVLTQLAEYATPARLSARLATRRTAAGPITRPAGWLLSAGLPRWGCGVLACESGRLWREWAPGTAERCQVCERRPFVAEQPPPPAPGTAPPVNTPAPPSPLPPLPRPDLPCGDCGIHTPDTRCPLCSEIRRAEAAITAAVDAALALADTDDPRVLAVARTAVEARMRADLLAQRPDPRHATALTMALAMRLAAETRAQQARAEALEALAQSPRAAAEARQAAATALRFPTSGGGLTAARAEARRAAAEARLAWARDELAHRMSHRRERPVA
ncbi:hypothetical protein GCM10027160_29280 [Streptomyces calidiresistens]